MSVGEGKGRMNGQDDDEEGRTGPSTYAGQLCRMRRQVDREGETIWIADAKTLKVEGRGRGRAGGERTVSFADTNDVGTQASGPRASIFLGKDSVTN